jgi:SAM-dependent methyltransferase
MQRVAQDDIHTAKAFAESWNRLPPGSAYTREQFLEWMAPVDLEGVRGKEVLELGFGNGSLLYHMARIGPSRLCGVELGDTLETARRNVGDVPGTWIELNRGDLTSAELGEFDLVYCIGVLHHLQDPSAGFDAVVRRTRPGGRFHCWVYAEEGNGLIRYLVDPLRRVSSRLPWWLTKYFVALPLVAPYFVYARALRRLRPRALGVFLPLYDYSLWIAEREFRFFHHVAFDQLVAPTTVYIPRTQVDAWLCDPRIEPGSTYVLFRNRNSWKFGGVRRASIAGASL